MAYNIKTIVKLFIIFLFFQLLLNAVVSLVSEINTNPSQEDTTYINFLSSQTNPTTYFGGKSADADANTLLQDFIEGMPSEGVFNDNILNSFLGIYKIIASAIEFIIKLTIAIILVPSIIMNILLFNFAGSTSLLLGSMIFVNLGFYSFVYYIIFVTGVKG